jgi:hypothetical protein
VRRVFFIIVFIVHLDVLWSASGSSDFGPQDYFLLASYVGVSQHFALADGFAVDAWLICAMTFACTVGGSSSRLTIPAGE